MIAALSIWRFQHWLVALISILFGEGKNEINEDQGLISTWENRVEYILGFSMSGSKCMPAVVGIQDNWRNIKRTKCRAMTIQRMDLWKESYET
jgi:hypothetical protein